MAKGKRGSGFTRGRNLHPLSPRDAPRVRTILDAIRANRRVSNARLATLLRLRSRTVIRLNSLANLHFPAEYGLRQPQGGRWGGAKASLTEIAARKERVRRAVLAGNNVSKLGLAAPKLRQILYELRAEGALPSGTRRVPAKPSGPHAQVVEQEYRARMRIVARNLLLQPVQTPSALRFHLSRRTPGVTVKETAALKWALRRRIVTALKAPTEEAVAARVDALATYLGVGTSQMIALARGFRLIR